MRRLVRHTNLTVDDLVYPLFVKQGQGLKEPIPSMSNCFHFSPDTIAREAAEVAALGIPAVLPWFPSAQLRGIFSTTTSSTIPSLPINARTSWMPRTGPLTAQRTLRITRCS